MKLFDYCSPLLRRERAKPKATPLPWRKLLVICAVLFVNNFGINMIFPFLPFMIHDFFPYLDKTELGQKAGYLGSAYFVGSFTGSLLWGWISDKIGRRPVLLMGMLGTLATELLFGFSQNFAWAIAARFLWGLLNGNLGVAKTYISEVCDDSNQAKGFSTVGTTGGLGRLSGSVIGGYLAQPASKFGPLKKPFFCKYPYSLPCIVGGTLAIISFVAAFLFLEETLYTKKNKKRRKDSSPEESSVETSLTGDRVDSSGSMQSNDSGIELLPGDKMDSDTEMIDLLNSDPNPDGIMMAESDVDTDSDFERVNSDTELLLSERLEARNLSKTQNQSHTRLHSCFAKFRKHCVPECIFTECAPTQCYGSARHSVVDSYESIVACVRYAKICGTSCCCCRSKKWTPGETESTSDGKGKLRMLRRSIVDLARLVVDRRVSLSTLLYGLVAFIVIISNEGVFQDSMSSGGMSKIILLWILDFVQEGLTPLLLVTDHDSGGYNMDDSEIGIVLMSAAVLQLAFQLLLYPRIAKRIGYRGTVMFGLLLFGVMSVLFPFSNWITGPIGDGSDITDSGNFNSSGVATNSSTESDFCGHHLSGDNADNLVNENSVSRIPIRVWSWLVFNLTIWIISRVMLFTSIMVLISNSSLTETRGTVNGYGQALCAIGRSLGPVIGAPLFAWSENTGKGWPLNYHFVFDLLAVGAAILVIVTLLLPKSIELKRIREPKKLENSSTQETRSEQVPIESEESTDNQDSERTQQSSLDRL